MERHEFYDFKFKINGKSLIFTARFSHYGHDLIKGHETVNFYNVIDGSADGCTALPQDCMESAVLVK